MTITKPWILGIYILAIVIGVVASVLSIIPVFNFYFAVANPCIIYIPPIINLAYVLWVVRTANKNRKANEHGWRKLSPILLSLLAILAGNYLYIKLTTTGF
jgi:hypothetical protein